MTSILFLGPFNAEVGLSDRVVRDPGDTLRISKKTGGIVALMAGLASALIFALVLDRPSDWLSHWAVPCLAGYWSDWAPGCMAGSGR